LEAKRAFFGGRVDGNRLFYQAGADETIEYADFTSLYPTVQKYDRFPVGHPEIITSGFASIESYFGLVKCKILPPRQLALPTLPQKLHGKLSFHLCQTCAETQSPDSCTHTDAERAILGTWVTLEVQEALKRGYEIQEIYEVYHWGNTAVHDPTTGTGGLFSQYVQTFLKLKTEASGYPHHCKTPEEKQTFVRRFFEKEGVKLDPSNITKNPGLRSLAKLALNNHWGKLAERENMPRATYITDEGELCKTLADPTTTIRDWHIINEDMVLVDKEHSKDFIPESDITNIFLACFVTAHARLRLYDLLMRIGPSNVLYYDTDSVIYIRRPGSWRLECGDFLGDLTNELPPGRHIVQFICCGPKNYGYMLDDGTCYVKIKGFTLNHENSQKLHFNALCDELFLWHFHGETQDITLKNPSEITRDKYNAKIYNKPMAKSYQVVYTKRVVAPDFTTEPYGYCI
jgi:hypothetical protein